MKTETLAGSWKELKGKVKERWGKLTDDDLKVVEGQRDQLAGMLQKRYGMAKEQAERESREFFDGCSC
ncbi:MAG TPA: CsbD family protein [Planctomycetaceae bacterium]|nr:CsbD family protein [Planctomycetaceae bacterium]